MARAVRSALQQTYASVEILLVDDGSSDNSLKIAERYANEFSNIVLISIAHHSLGKARNVGLEKAKGEYVAFLDSDDELEVFAIEKLVAKITSEESDIVICKFAHHNTAGKMTREEGWNKSSSNANDCACGMYEHTITCTVWAKLYKAELARRLSFVEGLWFEDRPYLLQYFLLSKKVSFESQPLWRIYSRPGSITRRVIEIKRIKDCSLIFIEELRLISLMDSPPELKKILFRHHLRVLVNTAEIMCVDRKVVSDNFSLQKEFQFWLNDYIVRIKESAISLGIRDRLDLMLLNANRYLGWKMNYFLLLIFKRKKINFISKLKHS